MKKYLSIPTNPKHLNSEAVLKSRQALWRVQRSGKQSALSIFCCSLLKLFVAGLNQWYKM
ncbi:MAG: hypothetical protein KBT10_06070 [Bacteroidales bacterium]|nr:hypothetical protein [Candidatus Sodaliphilus aphodohippi]